MSAVRSRGFILPMALFAIALISLAVVLMMEASWARQRQARLNREQLVADQSADTAVARVAFLLAASPLAARSLEIAAVRPSSPRIERRSQSFALMLDGRAYEFARAAGDVAIVRFALQDEAGLVNLNGADQAAVARLLALQGVPERVAVQFAARLADYTDADDLERLNGADGPAYRNAGLPPARNRPLDAPLQAFSTLGWSGSLEPGQVCRFLTASATLAPRSAFNPNTASLDALQTILDVQESAAMRVRATREKQLLLSAEEVLALSGSPRTDLQMRAFPSRSLRLIVTVFPTASQESYVYASRIAIAQQVADGPIEVTRLERPVRVPVRERARRHRDDPVVVLPDLFGDFAARNR